MRESCEDMEKLMSRAMDGECDARGLKILRAHLAECPDCRAEARAFERVDSILENGVDLPAPPPCPKMPVRRTPAWFPRAAAFAAAACLAGVAFFGGTWWSGQKTARNLPPSYSLVASAALWEKAPDSLRHEAALAALPLSEAVTGYQREVARLLQQEQVDWERVRRLVEAIGALRTDMELLTLHVAYLEKEQGKIGSAGAAWSGLLGLDDRGGSL
jgi:anti-sigma factor RsiW